MRLKTLTYTSRARAGMSERDVNDIHQSSRHLNALDGITGLLIYDGDCFLQILEGVEEAVDNLVERLRHDRRHLDFRVRDERFVDDRSFPDWSMNQIRVTAGYGGARTELAAMLPASTTPEVRDFVFGMIDEIACGS